MCDWLDVQSQHPAHAVQQSTTAHDATGAQQADEGDEDADDLRNQVKTFNLVTDMLIGGAIVGGAVTTFLYLSRPEVPIKSAFRVEPILGPQTAALSLSGEF